MQVISGPYLDDRRDQPIRDSVPEGGLRTVGEQILHRFGRCIVAEAEVELFRHGVLRKGDPVALNTAGTVDFIHLAPVTGKHGHFAVVEEVRDVVLSEAAQVDGHFLIRGGIYDLCKV